MKPLLLLLLLLVVSCEPAATRASWTLVAEHPHDTGCYTQGLEFDGSELLESGGQYGKSNVRRVEALTGKVLKQRDFPASVFAEGLTQFKGQLWVLSWKENVVYVLDPKDFNLIRRHSLEGEGWGITHDGEQLIMSNGSSRLSFRDPSDFHETRSLEVTEDGAPLTQINELEWHDGSIWANLYGSDRIVLIDAGSGKVKLSLDLSELRKRLPQEELVAQELNGIAHDPRSGHLWVTGKYWSKMYVIQPGR